MTRFERFMKIRRFWIPVMMVFLLFACGGGGSGTTGGTTGTGGSGGTGISGNDDAVLLSVDGGNAIAYTEAFHPTIACAPRVDWASSQVVLYGDYTGTGSTGGFEKFLDIMFGGGDAVGTYTVANDLILVSYLDGSASYTASRIWSNSSGTVTVTRSDTRIEGTFSVSLVDGSNNPGPTLSGSFGVDRGNSLSCP